MYAEFEIVVNIKSLVVIKGKMQSVLQLPTWMAKQHQDELLEDWELCKTYRRENIAPPISAQPMPTKVKALEGFKLDVEFVDGPKGQVCMKDRI